MVKAKSSILVIDNEHTHSLLISEFLKKAGYSVNIAQDGFKAIAACKVRMPDVIILDVHMPLIGGMEVYNRLKSDEHTRAIPIIFLGSKSKPIPKTKEEIVAAEGILLKPFEPNELLKQVRLVLKEKPLSNESEQRETTESKQLLLTDALTSLKTSQYLQEFLKTGIKQAKRYGVPLTVVIVEVDQHNELVKTFGQKAVNSILVQIASLILHQLRDSDIAVHTNPYEFTLVLTMTDKNGAVEVAERLRIAIAESIITAENMTFQVTASIGICQYIKQMDNEGKVLLSHARTALAQGHTSGGNVTLLAE